MGIAHDHRRVVNVFRPRAERHGTGAVPVPHEDGPSPKGQEDERLDPSRAAPERARRCPRSVPRRGDPRARASAWDYERFRWLDSYESPELRPSSTASVCSRSGPRTPGTSSILNPGTSASAAYFAPLAQDRRRARREAGRSGRSSGGRTCSRITRCSIARRSGTSHRSQELFDYYLGWLADSSITDHFQLIPDDDVGYARAVGHARRESRTCGASSAGAEAAARKVVVGGHSLGGSITTRLRDLGLRRRGRAPTDSRGLVFIDGGSGPTPVTPSRRTAVAADAAEAASPWLSFGGIPAPFAGLFNATGSTRRARSIRTPRRSGRRWPLLPAEPEAAGAASTNLGAVRLRARHRDLAAEPDRARRRISAASRRAAIRAAGTRRARSPRSSASRTMFSGMGPRGPRRHRVVPPAAPDDRLGRRRRGQREPGAGRSSDVHATHGHDLPKGLRIYAFGAALGGQRVLDAAPEPRELSPSIPAGNLTLDRPTHETYAHNDPNSAFPRNDFLDGLVRFTSARSGPAQACVASRSVL